MYAHEEIHRIILHKQGFGQVKDGVVILTPTRTSPNVQTTKGMKDTRSIERRT